MHISGRPPEPLYKFNPPGLDDGSPGLTVTATTPKKPQSPSVNNTHNDKARRKEYVKPSCVKDMETPNVTVEEIPKPPNKKVLYSMENIFEHSLKCFRNSKERARLLKELPKKIKAEEIRTKELK